MRTPCAIRGVGRGPASHLRGAGGEGRGGALATERLQLSRTACNEIEVAARVRRALHRAATRLRLTRVHASTRRTRTATSEIDMVGYWRPEPGWSRGPWTPRLSCRQAWDVSATPRLKLQPRVLRLGQKCGVAEPLANSNRDMPSTRRLRHGAEDEADLAPRSGQGTHELCCILAAHHWSSRCSCLLLGAGYNVLTLFSLHA